MACSTLFFPSVSHTMKPRSSSPRLGGIPRFFSVSSTLSYQTPIFMISRASSAVATLRPKRSESRHDRLDLLQRRHALTLAVPDIVLNADAHMLAQDERQRLGDRGDPHRGPERDDGTLRLALEPVHPIERIVAAPAAAVRGDVRVQGAHVDAVADQPLHDLELVHMRQREKGLNTGLSQALQVLQIKGRTGVGKHAGPGRHCLRLFLKMCSLNIIWSPHLRDVHHGGADGNRDGFRCWRYFREHVTRIVAQPIDLPVILGVIEGDRAANLDDQFGHGFLEAFHHVIEVLDLRRELSGRGVAHVEVQDGGASVVAIHRRLDLLIPGDGDVSSVARQPRRPIRCRRDDQGFHVLGIQCVVGIVHFRISLLCF